MKIGIGYDVHELVPDRDLMIGGIKIEHPKGLKGHSDGDVLLHAVIDALLGALGKEDIGTLFPDNDTKYKDIDSKILLEEANKLMKESKFKVGNLDCIIIAERPKMSEHISKMKSIISKILKTSEKNINIKATTTEGLGFTGREEGIAAQCVLLLDNK
ncbi:MAG: 2-C-methyl-D-erythritol 2,4-cyclodiphosphate synthase [Eubacteriales bacterium]